MFEKAARMKLRFPYRGMISAEDLWDLAVTDLDMIYKALHRNLRASQEESLLDVKTDEDETLVLQLGILKHIVTVKLQEAEVRKLAKEKREKKQRLMEIMAQKQDADLQGKSLEELQKMMEEL